MKLIAVDNATGQEFQILKLNLFENSNPKRPEAVAFDVTINTDPEKKGVIPLD